VQFFAQTVKPCFLGFQTLVFDRTFFFPAPHVAIRESAVPIRSI
jgi:hypothetical protein